MKDSNIALYRKYRPETFDEVMGQDHIVKTIRGALLSGKIAHAYLLCGPRGTGKTTIARIIASELGTSVNDIYEMDAASNRGINEARDIRESVRTLPFDSKYKVYILDEVHMLTKEAWNALLKTIEEPPAHIIFILATTELEKVPETIVSRCQTFILRKLTETILASGVTSIAKKEGYKIEEGGAGLIALLSEGSFRDALGTLQKVISYANSKTITLPNILEVTGSPDMSLVNDFLLALAHNDIERGYKAINLATEQNIDILIYLKMILAKLRFALMFRYAPVMKKEIKEILSENDIVFLEELLKEKPEHISSRALTILLESYQSQKFAVIDSLPLELALIKILSTPARPHDSSGAGGEK